MDEQQVPELQSPHLTPEDRETFARVWSRVTQCGSPAGAAGSVRRAPEELSELLALCAWGRGAYEQLSCRCPGRDRPRLRAAAGRERELGGALQAAYFLLTGEQAGQKEVRAPLSGTYQGALRQLFWWELGRQTKIRGLLSRPGGPEQTALAPILRRIEEQSGENTQKITDILRGMYSP